MTSAIVAALVWALPVGPAAAEVTDGGGGVELPTWGVSQTATPSPATVGEELTFDVTVTNPKTVSVSASVTDTLPAGVELVSATPSKGSCSGTSTVTCNVPLIPARSSVTVAIKVRPTTAGSKTNTVRVTGGTLVAGESDLAVDVRSREVSAAFDWTMPERAKDANRDGLLDTAIPTGGYTPSQWAVRLDACASHGGAESLTTYRWQIAGVLDRSTAECALTVDVPEEKIYPVKLTVTSSSGRTASVSRDVKVLDRLIVVMGDSYASGEGNPHTPIRYGDRRVEAWPTWADVRCHRSSYAGSARAARALEIEDPRSSVTYVSRACSGATIAQGILGEYAGIEPPSATAPNLPPQVDQVRAIVGDKKIDDLLISIGGNDIGFAKVLADCLVGSECHKDSKVKSDLVTAMAGLPNHYLAMRAKLNDAATGLRAASTYVTEYPDFTTDLAGSRCPGIGRDILWPLEISADESTWAANEVLGGVNTALQDEVRKGGASWRYTGGIASAFTVLGQFGHGYCVGDLRTRTPDRWVRTFSDSCDLQGPPAGYYLNGGHYCHGDKTTGHFHPNEHGHKAIGDRYLVSLRANPPTVDPLTPPAGGGGGGGEAGGGAGGGGSGTTTGGDTGALQPLPNGAPTIGGNLPPAVGQANPGATKRKPGKCAKLKGKKRAKCVKKRCGKLNRKKTRKKYKACVKKVTRKATTQKR